jgi:type IX secretion system PorP/SprF family membrane protein
MSQFPWVKVDNLTATFKQKVAKGLAFGINVFSDKAGDGNMAQFEANLSIAYHAHVGEKSTFSGALMGGYSQRSISPGGLRWNNQYSGGVYDPNLPSGENFASQSHGYGDYAAGLLWSWGEGSRYLTANDQKFINLGVSVFHLSKPNQSFLGTSDPLNWRWNGHLNSIFGIPNSLLSICPSALYMQQGAVKELTAGGLIKYKFREESKYTGYIKGAAISMGCFYRNKDAVIPTFLLEMSSYSIGVSYDTNISGLTAATSGKGGFEISLRYNSPSAFMYQNSSSRF